MARGRTVQVHAYVDDDTIETGVWCPSCALPSAVRVDLYTVVLMRTRVSRSHERLTWCATHGRVGQ